MVEAVFEMLWDCRYCGARKLLGLSHRHCPGCGAPQDPNARYFPAESEKVAVQDHEFVGADVVCRYCAAASSRRAHNCGRCGAPLAEGSPAQAQVADQQQAGSASQSHAFAAAPLSEPPRRPLWKVALPIFALLSVAVVVLLLVWKKERAFVVASHSWQRSIRVERLGPVPQSAWCSELPASARDVTRHRERHGSKQVPDGEDCRVHKQDRGDGTFKEERVCTPKLKDEPVFDEKCDFTLVKWATLREETTRGSTANPPPSWPVALLGRGGCAEPGCERQGARSESYTVTFKDQHGESYRCDFAEPVWSRFSEGEHYTGQLRALVGSLDCASLAAR
jgi:ribosomal protein L40E